MTRIKIIALFLIAVLVLSLCSCKVSLIEPEDRTTTEPTDISDGEEGYREYEVTKYELKENAFEVTGALNRYRYDELTGADGVIDVLNDTFGIELKIDETVNYENGYGNWFWENGEQFDVVSAAVSMSSKTGKFSFYYKPENKVILNASQSGDATEAKLLDKATEFANKFSFVTGELKFQYSEAASDLFYPFLAEGATDSEDLQVPGRTFYFTSEENSQQTVDANGSLKCFVECGNSSILIRNVQYFVVTLFADGTVISADNYITRAPIVSNGEVEMIDESRMDELLSFFTSTTENDTLIIKRIYVESYDNYFGYPEIEPTLNIEYSFKSEPNNVQMTQMSLSGFYETT